MPSWNKKDQRQYEHIKESNEERGVGEERAKEIAARTVNKRRGGEGRVGDLEEKSRKELYGIARRMGVGGRSKMNKSQLLKAVQRG
jgi:hypothetical protein